MTGHTLPDDDAIPPCPLYGQALLENPLFNKGSAFSEAEREAFGLRGLLPPHVDTLEEQLQRTHEAFRETDSDLQRHIYLRQLQDTNEILFYRLLANHLEEMLPIIYTPTVGLACARFSHIYRRPRGLADPLYLGWRHERITGDAYHAFVDEFVQAVMAEMPGVCLQWEDFATAHARPLLERYRNELLSFNDDIQGTAAVALGAVLAAVNVTGIPLNEHRFVFLGAGAAGVGVADYLRSAMVQQGLSEAEARARFFLVDKEGLLHDRRGSATRAMRLRETLDGNRRWAALPERHRAGRGRGTGRAHRADWPVDRGRRLQ